MPARRASSPPGSGDPSCSADSIVARARSPMAVAMRTMSTSAATRRSYVLDTSVRTEHSNDYGARMLTERDLRYVRSEFVPLEVLCRDAGRELEDVRALMAERWLPGPAYVLPDGTEMVPEDYFDYPDRAQFERDYTGADLEDDLEGYLDGTYFVCLRRPTVTNILRKTELVGGIRALLANPLSASEDWRRELRARV